LTGREAMAALEIADAVKPAFAGCGQSTREALVRLRTLIYRTAAETPGVGVLTESLKWGQPSYSPARPRTGSSVRLGVAGEDKIALFFICHTRLVERFRETYPDIFSFEGNRAIVLPVRGRWPEAELRHCIAMALTYHLAGR
jgi:hypothetical protein